MRQCSSWVGLADFLPATDGSALVVAVFFASNFLPAAGAADFFTADAVAFSGTFFAATVVAFFAAVFTAVFGLLAVATLALAASGFFAAGFVFCCNMMITSFSQDYQDPPTYTDASSP
jgi:hypothetical protein